MLTAQTIWVYMRADIVTGWQQHKVHYYFGSSRSFETCHFERIEKNRLSSAEPSLSTSTYT